MRVQVRQGPGSGWYVLGPRALRESSFVLIVGAGRFEISVRRGGALRGTSVVRRFAYWVGFRPRTGSVFYSPSLAVIHMRKRRGPARRLSKAQRRFMEQVLWGDERG